ncbi:hypothetical protein BDV32DRAFT_125496 [Aspergillus pseudonomiae]|nr:hypothetical protein BDV32DRAFT_125496 [Aspergillus pseudonomiae]
MGSCEHCVRGHRVTSCRYRDRPLRRINRRGRPSSTCSKCYGTTCTRPEKHTKHKTATKVDTHHKYPHGPLHKAQRSSRERNTQSTTRSGYRRFPVLY